MAANRNAKETAAPTGEPTAPPTGPEPVNVGGEPDEVPTGGATTTVVGGPVWSLGEAVRHTGTPRTTLQRRLKEGAIPGAERTEGGGWAIPLAGLIAAGIEPRRTPADTDDEGDDETAGDEVQELRLELERARGEAEKWRALAQERELWARDLRGVIEALSRSLPPGPAPARRRWGRRSR